MQMAEILESLSRYGGFIVLSGLFVWWFIEDRKRNTKLASDNAKLMESLNQSNENIANMVKELNQSSNNIAKSLEIVSTTLNSVDHKVDRNFEIIVKAEAHKSSE